MTLPGTSSATFTSSTSNPSTVSAASDWSPPTVSLQNPGSPVKNTVTLAAAAADGESGIKDVAIQYLPASGGSWVTICTTVTAPYSCSWNTRLVDDATYDLRAVATDNAGYTTNSEVVRTIVANTFSLVLGDPGEVVRGSVPLTVTLYNPSILPSIYRVEYTLADTTAWKSVPGCGQVFMTTYTCTWNTVGLANDYYDLRAVAVTGLTTTYSELIVGVLVDNAAPTVTITDPGSPLSGARTFAATAADADSGIAEVVIQYAKTGTSTFSNLCTIVSEPFSCRYDTTQLAFGSYTLRAIATDVAGNSTTSAVVTNRQVDNTVASVSLGDPGAALSGTVVLAATANSTATVTSVRIQRATAGGSSWTDICSDTSSPYSCSWNTTTVTDGLYDLRAVLLDATGKTTTSPTVSSRRVDNSPLRAVDVQTTNAGATAGRLETGDSISFTFSKEVLSTTLSPGWTGASALAVQVRVRDRNVGGLGADTLDVLRTNSSVNLGSVNLGADLIRKNRTLVFNATMTVTTSMMNGVTRTTVRVQLESVASGTGVRSAVAGTMLWTPSSAVTDAGGNRCSTTPVTETGTSDRDF